MAGLVRSHQLRGILPASVKTLLWGCPVSRVASALWDCFLCCGGEAGDILGLLRTNGVNELSSGVTEGGAPVGVGVMEGDLEGIGLL